jgi:mono/diheme cytochrome c family protein
MGGLRALCFLVSALALSACGYVRTTYVTTNEALLSEGTALTPAQIRFNAARGVMSTYCISCHAGYPSRTEAEWISSNLIVPGDSASSFLVGKIRNSGVSGAGDMPADGTNLAPAQIQTIRTWIDGLVL